MNDGQESSGSRSIMKDGVEDCISSAKLDIFPEIIAYFGNSLYICIDFSVICLRILWFSVW